MNGWKIGLTFKELKMSARMKMEEIAHSYELLKTICNEAKRRISTDNTFAMRIFAVSSSRKIKNKNEIADKYFDSLYQAIAEQHILQIIATFEGIVFKRLENAAGNIESIVTKQYRKNGRNMPFNRCVSSFIKGPKDVSNLGGAKKMMKNQIPEHLYDELEEIIDYRNWLSHGKRFDVGKESLLSFDEINKTLLRIIESIK